MELMTMNRKHYEEAIHNSTAVQMALEYLDECEMNGDKVDIAWMRSLLEHRPMNEWVRQVLADLEMPDELE